MAEISDIKVTERQVRVLHPKTGAFTGIILTLISTDDERMKAVRRAINDERLKLEARGKNFKTDDITENNIRIASAAIVDWDWGFDDDGDQATFHKDIPKYTTKNVKDVLAEMPWFLKFVGAELDEEGAFF